MFQIIGAMGEFERNLIRVRVKAGMAHAKAKGRRLGGARVHVDMAAVEARNQLFSLENRDRWCSLHTRVKHCDPAQGKRQRQVVR